MSSDFGGTKCLIETNNYLHHMCLLTVSSRLSKGESAFDVLDVTVTYSPLDPSWERYLKKSLLSYVGR